MRRLVDTTIYVAVGLAAAIGLYYMFRDVGGRFVWIDRYITLLLLAIPAGAVCIRAWRQRYGATVSALLGLVVVINSYYAPKDAPLSLSEGGAYIGLLLVLYSDVSGILPVIMSAATATFVVFSNAWLPRTVAGRWMSLPVLVPITWLMVQSKYQKKRDDHETDAHRNLSPQM